MVYLRGSAREISRGNALTSLSQTLMLDISSLLENNSVHPHLMSY